MPFNQAKERRSMYIFKKCLLARMSWHGILYDLSIFKMFGIKNLTNKLKVVAFSTTTQIYSKVRNQEEKKLKYRSKSNKLKVKAPLETGKRSSYCVLVLYLLLRI